MSCTPPADAVGFTAADWTAVVNEVLAELFNVQEVVDHFSQLDELRTNVYLATDAELPAIGDKLALAAAAENRTSFDPLQFFATLTEIAGSIAGTADSAVGAGLSVAGDLMASLPTASSGLASQFTGTFADLRSQFANSVGQVTNVLQAQSQIARTDEGLMTLLGQLRERGTWDIDVVGLTGTAEQAYAVWMYQELLPTMYDRYTITSCTNSTFDHCTSPVATGVFGAVGDSTNFTALGTPPVNRAWPSNNSPCWRDGYHNYCDFDVLPQNIATAVWGPLAPTCDYVPGNALSAWKFGCNLGVDPSESILQTGGEQSGWHFNNQSGNPTVDADSSVANQSTGTAQAAAAARRGDRPRVSLKNRAPKVVYTGRTSLPPGLRPDRARVVIERVLSEPAGRGELVRRRSGRAVRPTRLTRTGSGTFAHRRAGDPRVGLRLRQLPGGPSVWDYELKLQRLDVATPWACHALESRKARLGGPVELQTRLRISDGRKTQRVTLREMWRCRRDTDQNVSHLLHVRPQRRHERPGLSLSLTGPRTAAPGTVATYRIRVANRRPRAGGRLRSSLHNVTVKSRLRDGRSGGLRRWRIAEMRRGRARTFELRVRVPPDADGPHCAVAVATADSARGSSRRICLNAGRTGSEG